MAMLERDYAAAEKLLSDLPLESLQEEHYPKNILPWPDRPCPRRLRIGPALLCRDDTSSRKMGEGCAPTIRSATL